MLFKTATATILVVALGLSVAGLVLSEQQAKESKQQSQRLEARIAKLEDASAFDEKQVAKDQYQAVFMANGQVYFGHITAITKDTTKIEDVFYLNQGGVDKTGAATTAGISVVKLGGEPHAPDDSMIIERKNISFWENIKNDGQVAKAITQYKQTH
jgi:hypothetical protein